MSSDQATKALLQFHRGPTARAGADRMRLLAAIGEHGSITAAAKACGLSYKGAWDAVQALNNLFERPLVAAQTGGAKGGAASLTPAGEAALSAYGALETELARLVGRLDAAIGAAPETLDGLIWSLGMKTSARNALRGVVETVTEGAVNSEVTLRIAPDLAIVAVITRESVQDLGLAPGRTAVALIKSSSVILALGEEPLRTSARNQLAGTVARHERGAVNDEVVLDLGGGKTVTATITRESADALDLAVGQPARALIKASQVILAVD
ncbi:TOBE domain-containing protein [Phenylobacterium montanum]|uniref:TOBE domain-containing protein n=1 Tax=Phenylobacterium montanum TaxID=2823693 RepID=A0A975FX85_9CAUL|nr:TOBE domain-containing protein [Caulobacter sp. S6]QUD86634.1 TOBE domain-containing protein [Caulobacter sp. S6]